MNYIMENEIITKPWIKENKDVIEKLESNENNGLSKSEAKRRLKKYGKNMLQKSEKKPTWKIFVHQFKNLLTTLLIIGGIISFIFDKWIEGISIFIVVIINALLGFFTEVRAVRKMEALEKTTEMKAIVLRNGDIKELRAKMIVPGDILVLNAGDLIAADARIFEASKLRTDESVLTGESVPVDKQIEPIEEDTALAERNNMVYKGSAVTRGSGKAIVVGTGLQTELGNISSLIKEARDEKKTPLERRLKRLGERLIWLTLAIAVVVAVGGILRGRDFVVMIEISIALAVATVPEGLPIVATMTLARGMSKMAKNNTLINELSAVETLGSATTICSDKTGTLTENQMTVRKVFLDGKKLNVTGSGLNLEGKFIDQKTEEELGNQRPENMALLLKAATLCNNASLSKKENGFDKESKEEKLSAFKSAAQNDIEAVGDPMEVALLVLSMKAGYTQDGLLESMKEEKEVSFDPEIKLMATYNKSNGNYMVSVKGAPEAVLEKCSKIKMEDDEREIKKEDKENFLQFNEELAGKGLRVLGFAFKYVEDLDKQPYSDLTFLGLVGLEDPPRIDIQDSIEQCKNAGINIRMITGDQEATAKNIGLELRIVNEEDKNVVFPGKVLENIEEKSVQDREEILNGKIFYRVAPEQKLNLVGFLQDKGEVVAMTGDGVNDAPALEKADIGVAMGRRGTQVAREASEMILKDDKFTSIVAAVRYGRIIVDNIRKFVFYLLSCNLSEILVIFLATMLDLPLPIYPLQILFLNMVTDVFPAFALSTCEGSENVMKRNPRDKDEDIIKNIHWIGIVIYGLIMTFSVLSSFMVARDVLGLGREGIVTVSFLTLAFNQLWHVFNMREDDTPFIGNEVNKNRYVWMALGFCIFLLVFVTYVPGLSAILRTVDPGINGWITVLIFSLVPLISGQIWKIFSGDLKRRFSLD